MPGAEADLELLLEAARAAGELALRFSPATTRAWDKPGGAGPVTEADIAVNEALEAHLRRARPDYGWLSEESLDDRSRLSAHRVFIVDPIDGTRSFIEGGRAWAISVAVADTGHPMAGVVHMPAMGLTYAAARGHGARLGNRTIRVRTPPALPELLATRATLAAENWPGGVPEVKRHHRPSLAWRLALVAEGRFDGMATLRPTWEWDIAAGALIAAEAGARVTDGAGRKLTFNTPSSRAHGIIAAAPALHGELLRRLAAD